ncbi:hypothetical protein AB0C34_27590 [Nocardia sp. NPDC049220]|uniref:hypothetical protein n=1 Tax=Nocardia sp. NPDC049220 TaxID=3155273 RepID=UPI0033CC098E
MSARVGRKHQGHAAQEQFIAGGWHRGAHRLMVDMGSVAAADVDNVNIAISFRLVLANRGCAEKIPGVSSVMSLGRSTTNRARKVAEQHFRGRSGLGLLAQHLELLPAGGIPTGRSAATVLPRPADISRWAVISAPDLRTAISSSPGVTSSPAEACDAVGE